ncbi:F-box/kelch-repeat protein At3g23880-like [Rutidosis leptorrhynchoides]|uniref:F-box/kelch-repeat protein At3g23880-like n=1 Tax=Rutidosis leptorrhynchoides TaxID=125765 RepID=UPI003A99EE37
MGVALETQRNHRKHPKKLIVEILTRLPVESLLRCKSVCKSWCSIISDPLFVKSHLKLSSNRNNYANHRIIFRNVSRINVKTCNLYNVLYDKPINAIELDYPLKHLQKSVSIVGSCNGLLCIRVEYDTLFIWNPSTRRSNKLPKCNFEPRSNWFMSYGFRYDRLTDDYKVVGMPCLTVNAVKHYTQVKIYSLKTGNWKNVGDFPHRTLLNDEGKFSNGAIHWAGRRYLGSLHSWTIVSVGLGNESYGEVPQPVHDEGYTNLTLGVLEEKLCVVCDYRGKCADVWVMKVYGEQYSWTKLVSVPYLTDPDRYRYSVPLCVSNDGKVLLKFGSKLVVYGSKNSLLLEIQNFGTCHETFTFVESLVSPDSPSGLGDGSFSFGNKLDFYACAFLDDVLALFCQILYANYVKCGKARGEADNKDAVNTARQIFAPVLYLQTKLGFKIAS